ncbi:MAG: DUF4825 domain-containing protein [Filifactoraceae bacterium]
MKKYFKIILCTLALVMVLVGCSSKTAEDENQTIFIGDNSKVVQLLLELPYPKGMSFDSIEIQSEKEPYELKVFVAADEIKTEGLQECADKAFEKIHNMGIISFYNKGDNNLIKSFNRK